MEIKCILTNKICKLEFKDSPKEHIVFLGYQMKSEYFGKVDLLYCIQSAVNLANDDLQKDGVKLIFKRVGSEEGIHISCEICELINRAKICIFEISDKNPNVFFELGLASGKEIILLRNMESPEVPSDIKGIKYIFHKGGETLEGLQIALAKKMLDFINK